MVKEKKSIAKTILISMLICVLLGSGVLGYIIYDNSRIITTQYTYCSEKITEAFDGYKICFITDFHNENNYNKVINAVQKVKPDIICIGGDLINMEDTEFANANNLIVGLLELAPVYYSYGNHEIANKKIDDFKKSLDYKNVVFMNDRVVTIEKDNQKLNLIGYGDDIYDDFTFHFRKKSDERLKQLSKNLDKTVPSVLIMHRPQYFDVISKYNFDLTLAGHLHGGLINVPKVRDMILLEHFGTKEYCKGEYKKAGKSMFISAGIAKENKIYRVFNSPEIVLVELKSV